MLLINQFAHFRHTSIVKIVFFFRDRGRPVTIPWHLFVTLASIGVLQRPFNLMTILKSSIEFLNFLIWTSHENFWLFHDRFRQLAQKW